MMGMEMMLKSMGVDVPSLMQQLTEFTAAAKQLAETQKKILEKLESIEQWQKTQSNP